MNRFFSGKRAGLLAAAALACAVANVAWPAPHPRIPLWDAAAIEKACERTLEIARKRVSALERLPYSQATAQRVYKRWDGLQIAIEDTQGPAELLANVSPDPATRSAAEACQLRLAVLGTEVLQNENIYARFQRTAPAEPIDRKLRKDVIEAFEDTGVALPPEKRTRMKDILKRLEEVRQAFDRNIRDNKIRLAFPPEEMKGLPASYVDKARRDDTGNYLLGFEYPEYEPFMANAENEAARRRYHIAFSNRGTP